MVKKLLNLQVTNVDLVNKGANKRKHLVMKMANEQNKKTIQEIIKSCDFNECLSDEQKRDLKWQIINALCDSYWDCLWDYEMSDQKKMEQITANLEQFKTALFDSPLFKKEEEVAKSEEKGFMNFLVQKWNEFNSPETNSEDELDQKEVQKGDTNEVKPEEIQKMVEEAITKANLAKDAEIEEVKKQLEESKKTIKKAEAEKAEAEAVIKAEQEKAQEAEFLAKAEELKAVSLEKEEYAKNLNALSKLSPELGQYFENLVKSTDTALSTTGVFKELGHNNPNDNSPADQLEQLAQDIAKNEKMTIEKARVEAGERNPELLKKSYMKA